MKELVELIAKLKQDGEYYEEKSFSSLGDTVPTPGTICYRLAAKLEALLPTLAQSHQAEIEAEEMAAERKLGAIESLARGGAPLSDENDPGWSPAYIDVLNMRKAHQAELLAAEAAALRLAAEELHKHGHDRAMAIVEEHIRPDQQSALEALVMEVLRQEYAWIFNHSSKEAWERYQAMLRLSKATPGATN